ncbi:hypothetical protein ACFSTC_02260 [Nonomuraea ferruginea]
MSFSTSTGAGSCAAQLALQVDVAPAGQHHALGHPPGGVDHAGRADAHRGQLRHGQPRLGADGVDQLRDGVEPLAGGHRHVVGHPARRHDGPAQIGHHGAQQRRADAHARHVAGRGPESEPPGRAAPLAFTGLLAALLRPARGDQVLGDDLGRRPGHPGAPGQLLQRRHPRRTQLAQDGGGVEPAEDGGVAALLSHRSSST